jgi:16S rRNA (uracil1498-N3)-methyltransferase
MTKLFISPEKVHRDKAIIDGPNVRYLIHVLQSSLGEELLLLDGLGKGYRGKILSITKNKIEVQIMKAVEMFTESPLEIILAQGIPKAEKMDIIIQKATELGIKRIIPLITERTIMKPKGSMRLQRWSKIATSSAQQAGRSMVPVIEGITGYREFLYRVLKQVQDQGVCLIFYEGETEKGLKESLRGLKGIKEITFLIGPEGGFTDEEHGLAVKSGFSSVGLGPRILRTETAAITALSILQYELGDIL